VEGTLADLFVAPLDNGPALPASHRLAYYPDRLLVLPACKRVIAQIRYNERTTEMNNSLVVNEIFFSVQGESSYSGRPCAFVRLTNCNLRCTYCDTEYAFDEGQEMSSEEILRKVEAYPTDLVEITGGEPLLQEGVFPLIEQLLDEGKTVLIETGGSIDVRDVDPRAVLIYDIKCPGSGMVKKNRWDNLCHLKPQDEVKFVVGSRQDYEWASIKIQEFSLDRKHTVLFGCRSNCIKSCGVQKLAAFSLHFSSGFVARGGRRRALTEGARPRPAQTYRRVR
jgi:7-carboxy-7-deazaguanine synthase